MTNFTKILRETFGGNALSTILCTASRKKEFQKDTINTLTFALSALNVTCDVKPNVKRSPEELEKLVISLKQQIRELQSGGGPIGSVEQQNIELREKILELQNTVDHIRSKHAEEMEVIKNLLDTESLGNNKDKIAEL
jgi:septal ring factor EnvC (AmiA/AmiB activator)